MGAVKDFVIRIMNGGNDALVAASEWWAEEHCHAEAAAERLGLVVDCPDDEPVTVTRIVNAMEKEITGLRLAVRVIKRGPLLGEPWVSTSERLPDEETPVLVCCEGGEVVKVAWRKSGHKLWFVESGVTFGITHWQPLPKPPGEPCPCPVC
jgi:hypothetical protein